MGSMVCLWNDISDRYPCQVVQAVKFQSLIPRREHSPVSICQSPETVLNIRAPLVPDRSLLR